MEPVIESVNRVRQRGGVVSVEDLRKSGVTTETRLPNGNTLEKTVSKIEMDKRDIPIAQAMFKKYGSLESEKAQKEFFKKAWAWRKKLGGVVQGKQRVIQAEPEAKPDIAREWQLALCNIAHGNFGRLQARELFCASVLSALHPDKSLERFREVMKELDGE